MDSNNHKMMIDEKTRQALNEECLREKLTLSVRSLCTLQLVDITHNTTLDRTALPAQLLHSREASLRDTYKNKYNI